MPSGKVLVAGGNGQDSQTTASTELFDPITGTAAPFAAMLAPRKCFSATLLGNGALLVAGGGLIPALSSVERLPSGGGAFVGASPMAVPRAYHTASLLPSGKALLAGGGSTLTELYNPGDGSVTSAGSAMADHFGGTSTVLPTGEVLLSGGDTSKNELYQEPPGPPVPLLHLGKSSVAKAVPLLDGKVLVAFSKSLGGGQLSSEIFDPFTQLVEEGPTFPQIMANAPAVTLQDGRVLFAGGKELFDGNPLARIYDPATKSVLASGNMAQARSKMALTMLPDGRALVTGGFDVSIPDFFASTEIFDPETATFSPGPPMSEARMSHSATRLPNGDVLIAGGSTPGGSAFASAEVFNAKQGTFVKTGSMLTPRRFHTATLLANGKVLVLGGRQGSTSLASAEMFDPASGKFEAAGSLQVARDEHTATLLPSGKVLVAGGYNSGELQAIEEYDPRTKTSRIVGTLGEKRSSHSAALLVTGDVLFTGGWFSSPSHEVYRPLPLGSFRPQLNALPALVGGQPVTLPGLGFEGPSEAGTGTHAGGTSRVPVAVWMPMDGGLFPGGVTSWTNTQATYRPPSTALHGPGRLFVVTTGIPSFARGGSLAPGGGGAACSVGAACASGFCVDGVCCDAACTQGCQACSAAKKGGGKDGECGPVAAGLDPNDACIQEQGCGTTGSCDGSGSCAVAQPGALCAEAACASNVHAPAATCDGQGQCVPSVLEPCAPFVCSSAGVVGCTTSCTGASGCAPGALCKGGTCQFPADNGAPCASNNECSLGFCVDGVCCNAACTQGCQACTAAKKGIGKDGECGPVAAGSDPNDACAEEPSATCGQSGLCDGSGSCALRSKETPCKEPSCDQGVADDPSRILGGQCDGFGSCKTVELAGCGLFLCDDAPAQCKASCTGDQDCADKAFCGNGVCSEKLPDGATCTNDGDCAGGRCVDGVCCNAPCAQGCQACSAAKKGGGKDGECGPVAAGSDPNDACAEEPSATCGQSGSCDGSGSCALRSKETPCKEPSCDQGVADDPSRILGGQCDGFGSCKTVELAGCGLFLCDDAPAQCKASCTGDQDCADKAFCGNGVCSEKLPNGAACQGANQCAGGLCVDGFCCNDACGDSCEACDVPSKEGTCSPLPAGDAPRPGRPACTALDPSCGGRCDGGSRVCSYPGKETSCGQASCEGGRTGKELLRSCSGDGSCGGLEERACLPFACAEGECFRQCARDEECAEGYRCDEGACAPISENVCGADGVSSVAIDGSRQDCRPYRCGSAGVCLATCRNSGDCADDARCSAQLVCVPLGPSAGAAEDEGGCGCRLTPDHEGPGGGSLALLLAAGVAARRRRGGAR
jgi:hypothetical protein